MCDNITLKRIYDLVKGGKSVILLNKIVKISTCGGAKTWALALGLSPTFYQQYVRGEEIMGEPRN